MPTPPKRVRTTGEQVALGVLITFVVALVALVPVALIAGWTPFNRDSGGAGGPAMADVTKPDCSHPSGSRQFIATMVVSNSTAQERDYTVTVSFLRGDGSEITTGTGQINRLQPGRTARIEAVGTAAAEFLIRCEVTSVRRS